jgi:hypothetical protein
MTSREAHTYQNLSPFLQSSSFVSAWGSCILSRMPRSWCKAESQISGCSCGEGTMKEENWLTTPKLAASHRTLRAWQVYIPKNPGQLTIPFPTMQNISTISVFRPAVVPLCRCLQSMAIGQISLNLLTPIFLSVPGLGMPCPLPKIVHRMNGRIHPSFPR